MKNKIRDYNIENLLTSEITKLVPDTTSRIIIPCGALEAHGAVGLGTDTIIPKGLAEELAPRLNALISPAIPFGVLKTLANYSGSVTLTESLYKDLIYEIGSGFIDTGFDEIIFLNGHSGNRSGIKKAAFELHRDFSIYALVYDWFMEKDDITMAIYDGPGGHSGAGEVGLVAAFNPDAAPNNLWNKDDAGTLNPAIAAFPGPYPIILMEEDSGLPDYDLEKAKTFKNEVVELAFKSLDKVIHRWDEIKKGKD